MLDRLDLAEKAISRAGLRYTTQRRRILRCLVDIPQHFGSEEVLQALNAGAPKHAVSRATLYRFLLELERLRILRKVLLSEGHSHYEFALGNKEHCHLVCSRCGRVEEIFAAALDRAVEEICNDRGVDARNAKVEITIVCDLCEKQAFNEHEGPTRGGEQSRILNKKSGLAS